MLEIIDHDTVRELRLNRPPVNAFDVPFIQALSESIREGARVADALVLSGRPGMFSAGLDVPSLLQLDRDGTEQFVRSFFGLMEIIARSPIPVASALTGHCPAGGTVIVLFADYRVMCKGKYKIGLNEVQVGLPVPDVIFRALARLTGARHAERLVVSGKLISPDAAFDVGLVDQLEEDPEATVQAAIDWCKKLVTTLPRHAMLATRNIARADLATLFDAFGEDNINQFVGAWFDPGTQAGLRSMIEQLKQKKTR